MEQEERGSFTPSRLWSFDVVFEVATPTLSVIWRVSSLVQVSLSNNASTVLSTAHPLHGLPRRDKIKITPEEKKTQLRRILYFPCLGIGLLGYFVKVRLFLVSFDDF